MLQQLNISMLAETACELTRRYLITSDNPWVDLMSFSTPIVNIVVRKFKEDVYFQRQQNSPHEQWPALAEQRDRFRVLFIVGMVTQAVLAAVFLVVALKVKSFAALAAFALIGSNAAVSLPLHFGFSGFSLEVQ